MKSLFHFLLLSLFVSLITGCGNEDIESGEFIESIEAPERQDKDERQPACLRNLYFDQLQNHLIPMGCKQANKTQFSKVDEGNKKKEQFLSQCYQETNSSCWCDQLVRPNPDSLETFKCTYGENQVHQLIHPDEDTWKYAFEAVKIVEEFEKMDLHTEIIYNWWRPEPYNQNVGGSATRHPFGTSIDVRFKSKEIQNKAFYELCKMRKAGRVRAIGYYPSTALHFGVGDKRANTWGKACP